MTNYTFEARGVVNADGAFDSTGLFMGAPVNTLASINQGVSVDLTITLNSYYYMAATDQVSPNAASLNTSTASLQSITLTVDGQSHTWQNIPQSNQGLTVQDNGTGYFAASAFATGSFPGKVNGVSETIGGKADAGASSTTAPAGYSLPVNLNNPFVLNLKTPNGIWDVYLPGPTGGVINIPSAAVMEASLSTTAVPPVDPDAKSFMQLASRYFAVVEAFVKVEAAVTAAIALALPAVAPGAVLLGLAAALSGGAKTLLNELSLRDPPDPNWQSIAVPTPPSLTAGALPAQAAPALTALTNLVGLLGATETTYNRLSTAYSAGDGYWEHAQLSALQTYQAQSASACTALAQAMPALQSYAAGLLPGSVTASQVAAFQAGVNAAGLPSAISAQESSLGLDATTRQQILAEILSADPNQATALTASALMNATAAPALQGLATDLQADSTGQTGTAFITQVYEGIERSPPSSAALSQSSAAIQSGQLTTAQLETNLIASEQVVQTTLPALVTIDAFYGATPSSATLTAVATSTGSPARTGGFYAGAYLNSLGYSDPNVWTIMASQWGADHTSAFYQQYNSFGTNYSAFISAVYQREFGFAPSAASLQTLVNDVPGVQTLLAGGGGAATPIQVVSGIYGYLLYVGQTTPSLSTQYGTAANAFLLAAGNGTVSYGPELTAEFPANSSTTTSSVATNSAAVEASGIKANIETDPSVITITGSDQLVDPGVGSHTIQFLAGTSADTLVLHRGGVDQVSGFDPGTDVLDPRSLLAGTGLDLTGGTSAVSQYITVVHQAVDAVIRFDPSGHGGGSTVAVLQGIGDTLSGLNALTDQGAIRIA